MKRLFLTLDQRTCPFGCKYCFAKFSQYRPPERFDGVKFALEGSESPQLVYPACDVDLFAFHDVERFLLEMMKWKSSISISTKATLKPTVLSLLGQLADVLRTQGAVLKIGVSFSTKFAINDIEPGTAPYSVRVRNLQLLQAHGVSSCVVLKPVLRERPSSEYCEIIQDCLPYCDRVLIGEEYVDVSSLRRRKNEYAVSLKAVGWLNSKPLWPTCDAPEHLAEIIEFGEAVGATIFNSDVEVVQDIQKHMVKMNVPS